MAAQIMGEKAGNCLQFIHLITGLGSSAVNKSCTSAETQSLAALSSTSGQVKENSLLRNGLPIISSVTYEAGKLFGLLCQIISKAETNTHECFNSTSRQ